MTVLQSVYPINELPSLLDLFEDNSYFKQTTFNPETQELETRVIDKGELEEQVASFVSNLVGLACGSDKIKLTKCALFVCECKVLLPIYGALKEQSLVGGQDLTDADRTFQLFVELLPMASLFNEAFKHFYFLDIFKNMKLASFKPTEDSVINSELLPTIISVNNISCNSLLFTIYSGNPKTEKDLEKELVDKFRSIANFLEAVTPSPEEELVIAKERKLEDFITSLYALTSKYLEKFKDA